MATLSHTPSNTIAFGAAAPAVAPVRVRDRLAKSCSGSGTAEQMYGHRNAGDVPALVPRCLR
jgi:hypothetical protein